MSAVAATGLVLWQAVLPCRGRPALHRRRGRRHGRAGRRPDALRADPPGAAGARRRRAPRPGGTSSWVCWCWRLSGAAMPVVEPPLGPAGEVGVGRPRGHRRLRRRRARPDEGPIHSEPGACRPSPRTPSHGLNGASAVLAIVALANFATPVLPDRLVSLPQWQAHPLLRGCRRRSCRRSANCGTFGRVRRPGARERAAPGGRSAASPSSSGGAQVPRARSLVLPALPLVQGPRPPRRRGGRLRRALGAAGHGASTGLRRTTSSRCDRGRPSCWSAASSTALSSTSSPWIPTSLITPDFFGAFRGQRADHRLVEDPSHLARTEATRLGPPSWTGIGEPLRADRANHASRAVAEGTRPLDDRRPRLVRGAGQRPSRPRLVGDQLLGELPAAFTAYAPCAGLLGYSAATSSPEGSMTGRRRRKLVVATALARRRMPLLRPPRRVAQHRRERRHRSRPSPKVSIRVDGGELMRRADRPDQPGRQRVRQSASCTDDGASDLHEHERSQRVEDLGVRVLGAARRAANPGPSSPSSRSRTARRPAPRRSSGGTRPSWALWLWTLSPSTSPRRMA